MKYILIVTLVCLVAFSVGVAKGQYDRHQEEQNRLRYFEVYPSPLACHIDNSCDLSDLPSKLSAPTK